MQYKPRLNSFMIYLKQLNLLSFVKIILLTLIKVLGFFILAKYSLKTLGNYSFVGFSQIQQLVVIIVPFTTLFLQLVISKSAKNALQYSQKTILKFSLIGGICIALFMFFLFGTEIIRLDYVIPKEILNNFNDIKFEMSFFFAVTVFSTTIFGVFNAILIGEGQSSKLITTDLLINGIVILLAILFMIYQSEFLFTITPAVVLLIMSPIFIYRIRKYYINASKFEIKSNKIKGFVISSFFSSLSAPVAMYIFRSLLFFDGGYSEATEFIIVQKIIAAILIPTMLYLNNYVQPKYFIVNRDSFRNELLNDSKRILFLGAISVLLPLPFLHFIECNLFDNNIKISLSLFVLIGIAELSRNLSILLSYYCNVEGMWKTYIFGEILFILTYGIALSLLPHSKINFGLIYLFSILSTVVYYVLMVKKKINLEIKLDS